MDDPATRGIEQMSGQAADPDAVTVVIPTYNRAHLLDQTVESILGQEDVSVTLVIVNDASTDDTAAMLSSRYPDVTVIHHIETTEQGKARNDGARLARTPWIAFCDDDDLWAPTKLRRQLDAANSQGADWCTSSAILVNQVLEPIGGQRLGDSADFARRITRENIVPGGGSGVLIRTALFEHVGGFREDARYVEDWELWIRLSRHGTWACVDELLVANRRLPGSFSHTDVKRQYQAFRDLTSISDSSGSPRARPRHAGSFEVGQRLVTESRASLLRDLPRILRRSPEDWLLVIAMLTVPESVLRWLRLRRLGAADVLRAMEWLNPCRVAQIEIGV
jgi:glycosyltransferase involved in cell wall biosynthesis